VHLSEPPIALIVGIILGPAVLQWITPNFSESKGSSSELEGGWGWVS
jgi:NhaP-type Na+/H+ or K+/H+ antiporter